MVPAIVSAHPSLSQIRGQLFYGSETYFKNLPDFFIPERFEPFERRMGSALLGEIAALLADEPEVLVYVHLPFCVSECSFCNTFPNKADDEQQARYLRALGQEMGMFLRAGALAGSRVRGVHFGGGTPTVFSARQLGEILRAVTERAPLAEGASVTCEATPKTVRTEGQIRALREVGVTRLSIGCQSFDEQVLRHCNRKHTVAQLRETVRIARAQGVTTNVDLMLGLPGQTVESLGRDLEALASIGPDAVEIIRHEIVNRKMISLLERDPGLRVADDDLFRMVLLAHSWIEEHGYEQNGRFTSEEAFPFRYHWLHEMPILAFGARTRWYLKHLCLESHEDVTVYTRLCERGFPPLARYCRQQPREQMYRHVLLRLQLAEGLDRELFRRRYSADARESFPELFAKLEEVGCVESDERSIRLSPLGRSFVEDICCLVLDAALKEELPDVRRSSFSSGG